MNASRTLSSWLLLTAVASVPAAAKAPAVNDDLRVRKAAVKIDADLGLAVFEQRVVGTAGGTVPQAVGGMHGAPVLAYVFPTTLAPSAVGFAADDGILALAVTSHPDFDDTPLWDENGNRDYDDDGVVYHTHWAVLDPDDRVPGGLSVRAVTGAEPAEVLPPTAPGMPIYLDSPGFGVALRGHTLRVAVPLHRLGGHTDFRYDAVTAYMEVNTEDPNRPTLGVYQVYGVLSGDLSLPFRTRDR